MSTIDYPEVFETNPGIAISEDARELMVIFSSGQSLSTGFTKTGNYGTIWDGPVDKNRALMLDFGENSKVDQFGWGLNSVNEDEFVGFKPLQSTRSETHVSGMISQILYGYDTEGVQSPDILHVQLGKGGTSIVKLNSKESDIVVDIEEGLKLKSEGEVFVIPSGIEAFDYYLVEAGEARFIKTLDGDPTAFDAVSVQARLIAEEVQRLGYETPTQIGLAFIHGQSDTGLDIYSRLVQSYVERIESTVEEIWNQPVDVIASISQQRGYGGAATVPLAQLDAILSNSNFHLGALEANFQTRFPSVPGGDLTHLSPEGYMLMGQTIGARMYEAIAGRKNDPILIESVTRTSIDEIVIKFSGVESELIYDSSDYLSDLGFRAPDHFGFGLYNSKGNSSGLIPKIISSEISSNSEITLGFDGDISGDWKLYLGRNEQSYSTGMYDKPGTDWYFNTLRDSFELPLVNPGDANLEILPSIREFAPFQYVDLSFSDGGSDISAQNLIDVWADAGASILSGTSEEDVLVAARSGSVIFAEDQDDRLRESDGDDLLFGGEGADTFILDFRGTSTKQVDVLGDLQFDEGDKIKIVTSISDFFSPAEESSVRVNGSGTSAILDSLQDLEDLVLCNLLSIDWNEEMSVYDLEFFSFDDREVNFLPVSVGEFDFV